MLEPTQTQTFSLNLAHEVALRALVTMVTSWLRIDRRIPARSVTNTSNSKREREKESERERDLSLLVYLHYYTSKLMKRE